jgi:hypothetical protein
MLCVVNVVIEMVIDADIGTHDRHGSAKYACVD